MKCEAVWYEAMDAHRREATRRSIPTRRPTSSEMVALVAELVDRGGAYETTDGVYLSVETRRGLRAARPPVARRDARRRRRSRRRRRGEAITGRLRALEEGQAGRAVVGLAVGPGRPGWHTECVVMSLDLLGDGFDIHGGGQDLAFPHHENERAQAVALGKRFARHWVHNGFVEVGGEKMSKSLGNFTNLLDLIDDGRPARVPAARAAVALPLAGRGQPRHDRSRRAFAGRARRVRAPGGRRSARDGIPPTTRRWIASER